MADRGITESALAVIRQTGNHMPMWRARLSELLLADADELAASMIDAVTQRVDAPQLFNRPEQVQQVARAMAGLIQALAGWMVDPRPEMADAELAWSQATGDLTGRTGVPLPDLLAGHRIALAHLQQLLVARSEDWADSTTETAQGLALMSSFSEALIPHVTNAHAAGARRRAETLEATRLAAIHTVLAGGPFDEPRLGIRATRSHVGGGGKRSRHRTPRSHPTHGEHRYRARRHPDTAHELGMVRRQPPAARDPRRARRMGRRRPAGSRSPRLHRQPPAGAARPRGRLARTRRDRPLRGRGREALVWGGPAAAEQLVAHALGGLAGPGGRTGRVRETLVAWLECACSAAETARRLHLSERTVRYHLERAAELRGRALDEDLPALATALRLADQLPGKD